MPVRIGGAQYADDGNLDDSKKSNFPLDNLYPMRYIESMITVRETENFKKWIRGLKDRVAQSLITARIRRLTTGNFGDSKSIGNGVSELRIDYGPGFRVYFTRRGQEIVILLCGGDKSTQSRDKETAKQIAQNLEEA
jgi:putative addiction module killer protein